MKDIPQKVSSFDGLLEKCLLLFMTQLRNVESVFVPSNPKGLEGYFKFESLGNSQATLSQHKLYIL